MPIVKINDCGGGVNLDLMPEELPENTWSDCQNMRFRNGFAERFRGLGNIFGAPTITPYYITAYGTQTTRFWIHAGVSQVFADDGTTRTEITPGSPFTGSQDDRWTGGSLNGVLVMNNSIDQPHYWGGNVANDLAVLTGWNANWRCKSIRPFKNYLVALNVTKSGTAYPSMVKWSHSAVPGAIPTSWDETDVTLDAGEVDLAESPDIIVDACQLGDALIIYKERSQYSMTFIGAPNIFRFQRLPGDDGILAPGCVVNTPKGHVVLTSNDVVLFNGQSSVSIADSRVRDFIFTRLNKTTPNRAFVAMNPPSSEVLICFPDVESENCNKAAVWNWNANTWGFRDLPNVTYGDSGQINTDAAFFSWESDTDTWESDTTTWSQTDYSPNEYRLIFSRLDAISAYDIDLQDAGQTITSMIERRGMQFGDAYTMKLIRSVYPRIDAAAGTEIQVYVGASQLADQAPTYASPVTYTVGSSLKVDAFSPVGRYMAIKFECSDDAVWRIRSYDIDMVQTGAY